MHTKSVYFSFFIHPEAGWRQKGDIGGYCFEIALLENTLFQSVLEWETYSRSKQETQTKEGGTASRAGLGNVCYPYAHVLFCCVLVFYTYELWELWGKEKNKSEIKYFPFNLEPW